MLLENIFIKVRFVAHARRCYGNGPEQHAYHQHHRHAGSVRSGGLAVKARLVAETKFPMFTITTTIMNNMMTGRRVGDGCDCDS